jgi:hypothetical protein
MISPYALCGCDPDWNQDIANLAEGRSAVGRYTDKVPTGAYAIVRRGSRQNRQGVDEVCAVQRTLPHGGESEATTQQPALPFRKMIAKCPSHFILLRRYFANQRFSSP